MATSIFKISPLKRLNGSWPLFIVSIYFYHDLKEK